MLGYNEVKRHFTKLDSGQDNIHICLTIDIPDVVGSSSVKAIHVLIHPN